MKVPSAASISFREDVRASDCKDIRRIVSSSGFFSRGEIETAVELVEERLTRGDASGYHFLIAEWSGRMVGYTCFGPIPCTQASYDLYWIAVDDGCRGRGLGKAILKRTEDLIAGRGGLRIFVETSSRDQYEPTRAFYRNCGYREEARLEEFYAPGDDKVIFVKSLS